MRLGVHRDELFGAGPEPPGSHPSLGRPRLGVVEGRDPPHIVQCRPDPDELPVDHRQKLPACRVEEVRRLEVAVKHAHRRIRGDSCQQLLAHLRDIRERLGLGRPLDEPVPARHILVEWNRLSQIGNAPGVQPVDVRERRHRLLGRPSTRIRSELRGPLARPEPQHIPLELRHHEVRPPEPLEIVPRPPNRAMRHRPPVEGVQHLDLAENIRRASPPHVRRRHAQEPRLHRPTARDRKPVGEPRMPRHLVYARNLGCGVVVPGAAEGSESLFELV